MEEEFGFKDEIVIPHMSHKMYVAVVSYMESLPNHKNDGPKPLRINEIESVCSRNPPEYEGVHIGIESFSYLEAKEIAINAIQGLTKILYGELSLPSGQRLIKE